MNLEDLGMRFYVNQHGEGRWMDPEVAERESRDATIPRVWQDMTDASDDDLANFTRQNVPMAQTTAQRQEALRAKRAMLGMTEVRGVYLPPELHAELKKAAAAMLKKHKPEDKK